MDQVAIKEEPPMEYVLIIPPPEATFQPMPIKEEIDESSELQSAQQNENKRSKKKQKTPKIICDVCNKICFTKYKLKCHKQKFHPIHNTSLSDNHAKYTKLFKLKKFSIRLKEFDLKWTKAVQTFQQFHVCRICDLAFLHKYKLEIHEEGYHNKGHFTCKDCGEAFIREKSLLNHYNQSKKLTCYVCSEKFKCRLLFKSHIESVHGNIFNCNQCSYKGKTLRNLYKHKLNHENEVSCETCHERFRTMGKLKTHEMFHEHGSYASIKTFKCYKCQTAYSTAKILRSHNSHIHTPAKTKCLYCSEKAKSKTWLIFHVCEQMKNAEHGRIAKQGNRRLQCGFCFFRSDEKRKLLNHIAARHAEGVFPCAYCKATYKFQCDLELHNKTHVGFQQYKCDKCAFIGNDVKLLRKHNARVHPNETLKFECDLCQRKFATKIIVRQHFLQTGVHKLSKSVCLICREEFSTKIELFEHKKLHFENGKFACIHCSYSSTYMLLVKHIAVMHVKQNLSKLVDQFTCDLCAKNFHHKSQISLHFKRSHTCSICKMTFVNKFLLLHHKHSHQANYECSLCDHKKA